MATVVYVHANRQGGYSEKLNPDGSGWKVQWDWNYPQNAQATASISKNSGRTRFGIPYTEVSESSTYSTR